MAAAKNADHLVNGDPNAPRRAARAQVDQKLAEPFAVSDEVGASLYRTRVVGKVFYKDSAGGSWVCSGIVNSPARNMVSTAGHCVHEGDGGNWHSNWLFVPDYHVIGYPCEPENCQAQYNCVDPSQQATVFFPRQITMSCGLQGGSSGGPWLTDYQDNANGTGLGYVHGVTSNNDIFGNLRSPYFEDAAEGNLCRTFMNG